MLVLVQGIKNVSVQPSVSLQHLPYDVNLETSIPAELNGRLAFATQKLAEVTQAAKRAAGTAAGSLTAALPVAGMHPAAALSNSCMCPHGVIMSFCSPLVSTLCTF